MYVCVCVQFRRPDTTKSQYSSYLDYIRLIGETVGFRVQEDTLRIPSSKRVSQRQGSLVISGTLWTRGGVITSLDSHSEHWVDLWYNVYTVEPLKRDLLGL